METSSHSDRDTLIHELRERIRGLDCLYATSQMAADANAALDSILQRITDRIPSAFQNPETTCARIAVGNRTTRTVPPEKNSFFLSNRGDDQGFGTCPDSEENSNCFPAQ